MGVKMEIWKMIGCIAWVVIGIMNSIPFDKRTMIIWFAVAVIILLCFENKEAEKQ